ncbi:class I SAM-dependent methyltransferase [Chitinophaga sp. HK235]|uniref:class I SAM-dependent methyltransferase n=1 Tax=Chitinophaga sp. HK235 TaxID=2952571 RepID=UPI001BA94D1B|nr:methyltransferase domain-containing protein [Chitinophaga sp. HK235]
MNDQEFVQYNQQLFKKVAPNYKWLDLLASRCRGKFCRFLGDIQGLKILDVATGTGQQALAMAKRGAIVTGADLSEDMLHYAIRNDKRDLVHFEYANSTELPFDNETFDITVMSFALHCMTHDIRMGTLKEMMRVTKKDGFIAFIDHCKPSKSIGKLIYSNIARFETPLYKQFLDTDFRQELRQLDIDIVRHHKFFFETMQMIACKYYH